MTTAAVLPDPGRGTASPPACGPAGGARAACDLVAVARAAVAEALAAGGWSRSEPELVADLRETLALRAQVDALLLTQVAEVDSRGVAGRRACPSTRAWLRTAHRIAHRVRLPGWSTPQCSFVTSCRRWRQRCTPGRCR